MYEREVARVLLWPCGRGLFEYGPKEARAAVTQSPFGHCVAANATQNFKIMYEASLNNVSYIDGR